jgi:phenolic acid decarboxylase
MLIIAFKDLVEDLNFVEQYYEYKRDENTFDLDEHEGLKSARWVLDSEWLLKAIMSESD